MSDTPPDPLPPTEKVKAVKALTKAWKHLERVKAVQRETRHRELRIVQRAEKQSLQRHIREHGIQGDAKRRLLRELDFVHRRQHRDVDDKIRRQRLIRRAICADAGRLRLIHTRRSEPLLLPRAAKAMRDDKSLAYWNDKLGSLTDEEFIRWIQLSHRPTIQRAADKPEFDELRTLGAFWDRVSAIRASGNTNLQKQLGSALSPTTRGRKRKNIDRRTWARAKALQGRFTRLLQQVQDGDPDAASKLKKLLHAAFPTYSADQLRQLIREAASKKKPSEAAAQIAGLRFGIAPSRLKRGKAAKRSPKRHGHRVGAVNDLDAIIHAREARARGRRRGQPRSDDDSIPEAPRRIGRASRRRHGLT